MKNLFRKWLERRIEIILDEINFDYSNLETEVNRVVEAFRFSNRRKNHSDECPDLYSKNKPCHNMSPEEMYCFFCPCPEFDFGNEEGYCKLREGKGKLIDSPNFKNHRVLDCINCTYPHKKEYVERHIREILKKCHDKESARKYLKVIFNLNW